MSRKWTSRKLWSTLIAVSLELAIFIYSVSVLHGFNNDQDKLISAYIQIYTTFMVGINATVLGFVGVSGVVQWKHGTESVAETISQTITSIDLKPRPREFEEHDEHGDDPVQ